MKYEKHMTATGYNTIQIYDSGYSRIVPETRPAYVQWLSEGNILDVIPYIAPALPAVNAAETHKQVVAVTWE